MTEEPTNNVGGHERAIAAHLPSNSPVDTPDVSQLVGDEAAASPRFEWRIPGLKRPIPLWVGLVAMVVALGLAILVLSRVARPLYELVFPSSILVPDGATEIEHEKPDKGPESWVYRTTMAGKDVAAFYEREGGNCRHSPRPSTETTRSHGPYSVARCSGENEDDGYRWEVYIFEGYSNEEGPTIFRIYKFESLDF